MSPEINRRILIVDDTPANLMALEAVLEPLGAKIVQARSGQEALSRLAESKYDAVVMDVRMPGLDGFETAEQMRTNLGHRDTPILFVTASDIREEDIVRAYAQGHAELMPKPFVPEGMRQKLGTFLQLASKRERADRRMLEAEESMKLALTAANMVAWVCDRDSDVVVCSDGDVQLFGFQLMSISGFREHVHPEDRVLMDNAVEAVWKNGQNLDLEFRLMRDNYVRWIEAKGRLLSTEGGPSRLFGVSLDVTERHNAQLLLQELNAALQEARDKALDATHAKTEFLNAFGHELKTPLNGIINFAEMIEEELCGKGFDQICDDARTIRKLGAQLNRVIDQIYELAELDKSLPSKEADSR